MLQIWQSDGAIKRDKQINISGVRGEGGVMGDWRYLRIGFGIKIIIYG